MNNFQKAQANGESFIMPIDGIGVNVKTLTASATLTADDSGALILIGTDALVITLPSTVKGLTYEFINIGSDGNNIITISPAAADGIVGTITLAASIVTRVGTADTDLVNTKNTATVGNSVKIIGTGTAGATAWIIVRSTGIWA